MEFGLIIHWGLYSVPAYDSVNSAKIRKMQNGSEWYLKRLLENDKTFRPISGHKATKVFHNEHYKDLDYFEDFPGLFNKNKTWDPEDWVMYCKAIGATYLILTSKHHDGYCLWDTESTDFNSVKTGCGVDIIKELGICCKKHGIEFGIYYSWCEFNLGITKEYLGIIKQQITELIEYKPDLFWFDGHWEIKTQIAKKTIEDITNNLLKDFVKNDRTVGNYSYKSFEKKMPNSSEKEDWEYVDTVGYSWGRNKDQKEKDYKSPEKLIELYTEAKELGCKRFTLNLGPDSDGSLDPYEEQIIAEFRELVEEEE